jgi:hypothetical protein
MKPRIGQHVRLKPEYRRWLSKHLFEGKEVNPWATVENIFTRVGVTCELFISTADGQTGRKLWTDRKNFTIPRLKKTETWNYRKKGKGESTNGTSETTTHHADR